jgi:CHAT domain-containing protein
MSLRLIGNRLFQMLFGELAKSIPENSMIALAVPEPLEGLPIGALVTNSHTYFSEQYQIWIASGASARTGEGIVSKNSVAVAVATGSAGRAWTEWLPPLPHAEKETVELASRFVNPLLLMHRSATVDKVLEALPKAELFHFAGHTYSGAGGKGLLLAPHSAGKDAANPEMLTNDRLEKLNLKRARLAVLSSCETAGAAPSSSRLSLARLFLQLGTEWVVATNWNTDSAVSAAFMKVFYGRLTEGDSVSGALRTAADAIRANPVTQHPYYWAVYVGYGPH